MHYQIIRNFTLALLVLAISYGCSNKDLEEPIESTEQAYYSGAKSAMRSGNYNQAVELLEELESRYPFGRYAEQAQLDLIYAHYRSFDREAARASADRFIRLHPQHDEVGYAYYLRGLSSFSTDGSIVERFFPTDQSKRDVSGAQEALSDFSVLLNRFPDSEYAADARDRMVTLRNLLAASEIHVARYYLRRSAFVAAANRGRYVVENFQQTPSVSDGLAVMVEAYQQLGIDDLAEQSLSILALNYPDYPALRADGSFNIDRTSVGSSRSWLNRLTFGLIGRSGTK